METPLKLNISSMMTFQEDGRCTNAYKIISTKSVLLAAYLALKSKPGMMTKGVDQETLDGIDMK